jgi:hypothetical protein
MLLLAALVPQEEQELSIKDALAAGETIRVDGVMFLMNDEVITESMVARDAQRILHIRPDLDRSEVFSQSLSERLFDMIAREGFNRFGLDGSMLQEQVTARVQEMIEDQGSRARFDQSIRADGYDFTSFRAALEASLIRQTWRSIITGEQPSPLQGRRNQIVITPAEVRAAYEENPELWKQSKSLVWSTLQFFDNDSGSGAERARAMIEQLQAKTAGAAEAKKAADSVHPGQGDPTQKNLRPDIETFLLSAQEGEVGAFDLIAGYGAQFVYLEKVLPAHDTGFDEAQGQIVKALRQQRMTRIVNDAISELNRTSYIWFPNELKAFMSSVPGLSRPNVEETEF